jgi:hypothetical protein
MLTAINVTLSLELTSYPREERFLYRKEMHAVQNKD